MACAQTETAATAACSDGTAAAAVLDLALVPAGGAGGSGGGGGRSFRIGPEHHGYVYTETPTNMTDPWHNAPVYRCSRDWDLQQRDRVLFLYKTGCEHWVAVSAPANDDDPILDGQPVFRTIEKVDPTVAGTYRWQQWDYVSSTWQWDMRFATEVLP